MIFRALLILIVSLVVFTVVVKLLGADWRGWFRRTRDVGSDALGRGREAAAGLGDRAADLGDGLAERAEEWREKATDATGALGAGISERLAHRDEKAAARLARAFVVAAPVDRVAPLMTMGMQQAPLFDSVNPNEGEQAAWVYEALGTARLALAVDPRSAESSVIGVTSYEVVMGDPQGGSPVEHALDRIAGVLATHELPFEQIQRSFTGTTDSDGVRYVRPLG